MRTAIPWLDTASISASRPGGRVAIAFLLLAALTVTWTGIKLPGFGALADIFIVLSLMTSGFMVVFGGLRFSLPGWVLIPCPAIIACVLVRQFDPEPFYLRVLRFQVQGYRPENTTKAVFWLFAILFVPLAIIACTAIDRRVAVWTMGAYVTGATISSIIAITDLTGITPKIGEALAAGTVSRAPMFGEFGEAFENGRMPGLSDHPNTLGFTVVYSIPITIYFMGRMRRKWIAAIALIILFGAVLASGSRIAQGLAPIVALAAIFALPNRRSLTRVFSVSALGIVAGLLVVIFSLPSDVKERVVRVTSGFTSNQYSVSAEDASDAERLSVLKNGLADWQRYPVFGAGIRHIVEAHNIYVQLLASGGIVLLAAMLIYWFSVLRESSRLSKLGVVYARFLMLTIGTWLVLGMVGNELVERYAYFAVGCVAALTWANSMRGQDGAQAPDGAGESSIDTVSSDKEWQLQRH